MAEAVRAPRFCQANHAWRSVDATKAAARWLYQRSAGVTALFCDGPSGRKSRKVQVVSCPENRYFL
jgi:hypothetical protein